MQVYLLRHGVAEDARPTKSDEDRALTASGKKKLRQVLAMAADIGVQPELILSSPLKRAWQTATIAAKALDYQKEIQASEALSPGMNADEVWEQIRANRGTKSLMLVGHNPQFGRLASFLIGAKEAKLDFRKGALMRVDFKSVAVHPRGSLEWYLTARLAKVC